MDLQYPVGKFHWSGAVTPEERNRFIDEIESAPAEIRAAVAGMTEAQLDTPYRPGGWTVRQVVHHVPDSHINSYVRFKLTLTESDPAIKGYDQDSWSVLPDSKAPVEVSLDLLDALHRRWVLLLRSMSDEDFKRTFVHSELGKVSLDRTLALYAWHGRHHTGHILSVKNASRSAAAE
jgi:uncharacterized damage-inducible protein DinB